MPDLTTEIVRPTVRLLHDGWTVTASDGPVPADLIGAALPASVPGCVHADLLAAGAIADPYVDDNEALLAWIGRTDWSYRTVFVWAPDGHARNDLVFEGLDTVARVLLNGAELGRTANQHRTYRFDARAALQAGENELVVEFSAPVREANRRSTSLGARPHAYALPFNAIRKSASSFGWDWGPATATSGIVGPVRLESWSLARLREVRLAATVDGADGTVTASVTLERDGAAEVALHLDLDGTTERMQIPGDAVSGSLTARLSDVERWWPVGHGGQRRYPLRVSLVGPGGELETRSSLVGFRSVRWDVEPDEYGRPFQLVINDRPIFVKGVNWIPDDALTVRVGRARLGRRLRQALEANVNLVRVWGGGQYETEDFYDLCDELGLLTWQDFLFACAAYAEEEPLRSEVDAEAREQIVRLAPHPSLVLLNGNNENLWGHEDWGWRPLLDGRTWGIGYYERLLPDLVAELAPGVPYTPGSPFSTVAEHPNDESDGSMHLWEQWNRLDWSTYRDHVPRFVAEFGWQGPPTWTTLLGAVTDDPLTPESPGMIAHQKAIEGSTKLAAGLVRHFREPGDMRTWHWAMQLNQALAVRAALEHFRSWHGRTSGAIVWQLNDCWPAVSWAAVDSEERPKPLLHALQQAFAPRLVTVQPRPEGLFAVVVNDSDDPIRGDLRIARLTFAGDEVAVAHEVLDLAPRSTATVRIQRDVATPGRSDSELLVVGTAGLRAVHFFTEPRDSALPAAGLRIALEHSYAGTTVVVRAAVLVRELVLLADQVHQDAVPAAGLLTLLPGEEGRIAVRHPPGLVLDERAVRAALRTANELVTPRA